jgi:hypothetical protein
LDLHLQEIFHDTMKLIFPGNPMEALDEYLQCDEWRLYHTVKSWLNDKNDRKKKLGQEWQKLYNREVKWKMSYATEISIDQIQRGSRFGKAADYEQQMRKYLPASLRNMVFRVDMATHDPRPINPMAETEKRINIYNPTTGATSPEPLKEIYRFIPARIVHFRVFSLNHEDDKALTKAAARVLETMEGADKTNT